jgi:heterotetrameric sarcosine oxidase gamma subunit
MVSLSTHSQSLLRVQSWDRCDATVPDEVNSLLQVRWPFEAGTVATGRVDVICINPADWLIVAGGEHSMRELLQSARNILQGSSFRLADVSCAIGVLRITGEGSRSMLANACSMDLGTASELRPGQAPRTQVAGLPTIVRCKASNTFELFVASSYLDYMWAWLTDSEA